MRFNKLFLLATTLGAYNAAAQTNYFGCQDRSQCKLLVSEVANSQQTEIVNFEVNYKFNCHSAATNLSNIVIDAGDPNSRMRLRYGVEESITLVGPGPIQLSDTNDSDTLLDRFQTGCHLHIDYETTVSLGSRMVLEQRTVGLTTNIDMGIQFLNQRPIIEFWAESATGDSDSFGDQLNMLINILESGGRESWGLGQTLRGIATTSPETDELFATLTDELLQLKAQAISLKQELQQNQMSTADLDSRIQLIEERFNHE